LETNIRPTKFLSVFHDGINAWQGVWRIMGTKSYEKQRELYGSIVTLTST
jgi:hypothetical protein